MMTEIGANSRRLNVSASSADTDDIMTAPAGSVKNRNHGDNSNDNEFRSSGTDSEFRCSSIRSGTNYDKDREFDGNSSTAGYSENGFADGNGFSVIDGKTASRSFSFATTNDNNNNSYSRSPFSTLKKQKNTVRSAVRAVKDRFRSMTPRRIDFLERCSPTTTINKPKVPLQTPKNEEDCLTLCRKELDVSLRYLQNVILKDKLVMLPGSASIVLDTVLKLLLALNEQKLAQRSNSVNQKSDSSKPDSTEFSASANLLPIYDKIYKSLAELLKYTDLVILTGGKTMDDKFAGKTSIGELCDRLKQAIEDLLHKFSADRMELAATEIRRAHSLCSHASSSNDVCSILGNEEEPAAELSARNSDSSVSKPKNSDENFERAREADGDIVDPPPPPKPPHPPLVLFNCSNRDRFLSSPNPNGLEHNGGGHSPPSADSGVESLNTTDNSGGTGCEKIHDSDYSSFPLDEFLLSKLNSPLPARDDLSIDPGNVSLNHLQISAPLDNGTADRVETQENSTSEEKSEIRGNTLIKTRKVTTKQIVRQTVVTTKQSVVLASDLLAGATPDRITWVTSANQNQSNIADHLLEQLLLNADWSKGSGDGEGGEIKIKETENFVLSGFSGYEQGESSLPFLANRFLPNVLNGSQCQISSENPQIICTVCDDGDQTPVDYNSNNASSNKRPISVYDNEKFRLTDVSLPVPFAIPQSHTESENITSPTQMVRYQEQNCMQQSRSLHSVSRQALINGHLVASQSEQTGASAILTASESACFQNGILKEVKGHGAFESDQWSSKDSTNKEIMTTTGDDECDSKSGVVLRQPPSPERLSGVLSYVRIFGSSQPVNQADFCAVSLASYIHLRERWRTHEQSWRKKAFTFQFSNSGFYPSTSSSTNHDSPLSHDQAVLQSINVGGAIGDRQPWMELEKSATTPRTALNKNSRGDLRNLMDLLEINDKLNFPGKYFEKNQDKTNHQYLQYQKRDAISYVCYLDETDVDRFLVHQSDDSQTVKGGPVDALIAYVTTDASRDKGFGFQEMFVTTHRTFMTSFDLLTKLIYRYEKFNDLSNSRDTNALLYRKVAKNTFSLLVSVVDDFSQLDFSDDLFNALGDFLYRLILSGQLTLARYLRRALSKLLEHKQNYTGFDSNSLVFTPFSPKSFRSIRVVDFKSTLLAEQFTYLDWYYFKKIEVSELLFWAQQQTEERSPNLAAFTAHFNRMSYWVRTRILNCSDSKERETVFAKFLKVMRHLQHLGNFNSLFAMLSALDSGSIRRLDWPKWIGDQLTDFATLTDSSQSFKTYRNALADRKPPCLPYIGVILQDLTFVHVGNANFLPESQCDGRRDIVNVTKRWQQYTILDNMLRFKAWPYNIKKSEQVLAYLNLFDDYMSEEEIWEKSEKIKPRVLNKR